MVHDCLGWPTPALTADETAVNWHGNDRGMQRANKVATPGLVPMPLMGFVREHNMTSLWVYAPESAVLLAIPRSGLPSGPTAQLVTCSHGSIMAQDI